jgi:hypothetical protein
VAVVSFSLSTFGYMRFCVVFYMLFVFVLCLVSNAVCVSGLSIVDCHFGFLLTFIQITLEKVTVKAGGCKD